MSGALTIVRAALADAPLVGRLHAECWRGAYRGIVPDDYLAAFTPEKRAEKFRVFLTNPDNEHYVVYAGETPAGLLCVGKPDDDLPEAFGEVHALYLLPAFWGQGHGCALMAFALERLSARGYSVATLKVLVDNARARRFYEAAGFVTDGVEELITLGKALAELRYQREI